MRRTFAAALVMGVLAASCGGASEHRLVLIAYDSFTPPADAFEPFTDATGVDVVLAVGGDAGELVAKAALTAGKPEGDVLWGVDNSLLSRALDARVFDPYVSNAHSSIPELVGTAADTVTPVDFGDVCVNYDIAALRERGIDPPRSFEDLIDPAYRNLLAVPSAVSSSPGLAFLLATIARFGDPGWVDYWKSLIANGTQIVSTWTDAYYSSFTRYGGDRPLVLSYASSPPAEVIFADPPLPAGSPAPTGVVTATCFRQIEYAGVLRGSAHTKDARRLVDYLTSPGFQALLPESLFVYPANPDVALPESFTTHAPRVSDPITMSPSTIAAGRAGWLDRWSAIVP